MLRGMEHLKGRRTSNTKCHRNLHKCESKTLGTFSEKKLPNTTQVNTTQVNDQERAKHSLYCKLAFQLHCPFVAAECHQKAHSHD